MVVNVQIFVFKFNTFKPSFLALKFEKLDRYHLVVPETKVAFVFQICKKVTKRNKYLPFPINDNTDFSLSFRKLFIRNTLLFIFTLFGFTLAFETVKH